MDRFLFWLYAGLKNVVMLAVCLALLASSVILPGSEYERIRAYTRDIEFDYVNWSVDALAGKYDAFSIGSPRYMSDQQQHDLVLSYLKLVDHMDSLSNQIETIYSDPKVTDPKAQSANLSKQLADLKDRKSHLQPMVEAVLQYQVSVTITQEGLATGGQVIPPVLYHVTDLPYALVISPRNIIREDADISLEAGLTLDQITQLEKEEEKNLNVSALVVPVGGVGIYPTMVMSTTDLSWLLTVIAHEWTHNFLTLRPLGMNYETSEQLRTMNETTANISGDEIGYLTLKRFYPEMAVKVSPPASLLPEQPTPTPKGPTPTPTPENPNVFNYNHEMHKTRVQVDALLAAGKISEAEAYMEARRQFFWDHGYHIRRINQAYFAFYGAYADNPGGGAAGQDPVGPAVQKLRRESSSLSAFLYRIAAISSFSELQGMVK